MHTAWADAARDERVRGDLNHLVGTIRARHPNPFTKISSNDFDRRVQELSEAIPSLSDVQAYVRLMGIAAAIGDAHTSVGLAGAYNALGVGLFPLRFTLYDDGFFVSRTADTHRSYLGRRVVTVNGRTTQELIRAARPYVSFDNEPYARHQASQMMVSPQLLHAMGIGEDPDSAVVVLEDGGGQRESITLPGTSAALSGSVIDPSAGYLSPTYADAALHYWYRYYPEQRLLFFKYNRCAERPDLPFPAFAEDLFRALDSQPVDHLVVDLRDNGGGDSEVWRPFLSGLTARYGVLRERNPAFGVYGLISRLTFSSAMFAAQELKRFAGVRLVGEATGGNPESFGNVAAFSLPSLPGAGFWVSTRFYWPFVAGITPPAIEPDIRVRRNSSDVFARFDPVLFAVFAASGRTARGAPLDLSSGVFSAAHFNLGTGQSPGALSTVFGDFGSGVATVEATGIPLPRQLAGWELTVGGRPAPLLLVSRGQINFQQPEGTPAERETVTVRQDGVNRWTGWQRTTVAAPALFTANATDFRRPGAILNSDGSLNSRERPARRGESLLIFATGYPDLDMAVASGAAPATGSLPRTRTTPRVFIGQWDMRVLFSGASPEFPGLWQINATIPEVAGVARLMPIAILSEGELSNPVSVWVEE
jgi:uncharacterized protein (TIGR03437 family)